MGYVNMFNRGVGHVQTVLKKNGNLPAEFNINFITAFKVEVYVAPSYATDNGGNVGGKNGGKNGDVPSLSLACHKSCPQLVTSLFTRRRKGCKY